MVLTLRQRFLNLPNYITMGRLLAVGVVMILMCFLNDDDYRYESANRVLSFWSAGLFVLAMLSDILDGYFARKRKIISTFGQFFDPLADKLLFLVAMIFMAELKASGLDGLHFSGARGDCHRASRCGDRRRDRDRRQPLGKIQIGLRQLCHGGADFALSGFRHPCPRSGVGPHLAVPHRLHRLRLSLYCGICARIKKDSKHLN